jgi:uncharacterized membrane protein
VKFPGGPTAVSVENVPYCHWHICREDGTDCDTRAGRPADTEKCAGKGKTRGCGRCGHVRGLFCACGLPFGPTTQKGDNNVGSKTLRLCLTAMFCALSAVGAQIRIFSSIAFDSLPAFLAAALLGGPEGAVVGAAGHMLTAALSGFPYTLPLHMVIAAEMAGICFTEGYLVRRKHAPYWLGALAAFILNAFVSPLILLIWPGMGAGACLALAVPLAAGSAVNAAGAAVLAYALDKPFSHIIKKI